MGLGHGLISAQGNLIFTVVEALAITTIKDEICSQAGELGSWADTTLTLLSSSGLPQPPGHWGIVPPPKKKKTEKHLPFSSSCSFAQQQDLLLSPSPGAQGCAGVAGGGMLLPRGPFAPHHAMMSAAAEAKGLGQDPRFGVHPASFAPHPGGDALPLALPPGPAALSQAATRVYGAHKTQMRFAV